MGLFLSPIHSSSSNRVPAMIRFGFLPLLILIFDCLVRCVTCCSSVSALIILTLVNAHALFLILTSDSDILSFLS